MSLLAVKEILLWLESQIYTVCIISASIIKIRKDNTQLQLFSTPEMDSILVEANRTHLQMTVIFIPER